MNELVLTSKDGEIGILTVNNPPVNALSPGVPEGIIAGIEAFERDDAVKAMVLIGGGRTFIAGADIREFGKITSGGDRKRGPGFVSILDRMKNSSKPIVAAIHGTALGGGLETAMACHYRVAVPSAQVGQPEVKLGLIPGAGGTQRLPRLAGAAKGAEMCASGDPIGAADALSCGIVDKVIEGDLLQGAVAFAREAAAKGGTHPKTRDRNDKLKDQKSNLAILSVAEEAVKKKARNLFAPQKAVVAVKAALTLPFAEGIKKERELFTECLFSDQSKALIHVFFGDRAVARVPGVGKNTPTIP